MLKNQRGFILPLVPAAWQGIAKLVLILLILGAIAGIVASVKGYITDRDAAIFKAGEANERGKWQAREITELQTANAEIERLNNLYRGLEQQNAQLVAAAELQRSKEAKNVEATRDRTIAAIRAGKLVLRDPGRPAASGQETCRGEPAAPGALAAGTAGAQGSELSIPASEFLSGEAARADLVVVDFNACIVTLAADRKVMLDAGLQPASQ